MKNLMDIKAFKISFSDISVERRDTAKIRAYIASRHPHLSELHNHMTDGRPIYRYPLVQYKVIDGKPLIIGLNEGGEILESFILDEEKLVLNGQAVEINEKHIIKKIEQFGLLPDQMIEYKFKNPWFALNSENYKKYVESSAIEKIKSLEKILIGNLLSVSKGLGYTVNRQIECRIMVNPLEIKLKDKTMLGFNGNFMVNFHLPDHIGLGKMVSRGFGAIEKIRRTS